MALGGNPLRVDGLVVGQNSQGGQHVERAGRERIRRLVGHRRLDGPSAERVEHKHRVTRRHQSLGVADVTVGNPETARYD